MKVGCRFGEVGQLVDVADKKSFPRICSVIAVTMFPKWFMSALSTTRRVHVSGARNPITRSEAIVRIVLLISHQYEVSVFPSGLLLLQL